MTQTWKLKLTVNESAAGPEAPTLVLGHSLGSGHLMWDSLVPLLTPWVRLIRFDLPGHAGSPVAPITEPMNLDIFFSALTRSLDDVGVGSFHFGGLSIGGLLALAAPARVGERLLSTTCMSSGPRAGTTQMWAERIDEVRAGGVDHLVSPTIQRWFTPEFANGRGRHAVALIEKTYSECDPLGYIHACQILAHTDVSEELADITCPVLVVAAEHDAGCDHEAGRKLVDTIRAGAAPWVQLLPIASVRHMSAMEAPHLVAGALVDLIVDVVGEGKHADS